MNSWSLLIVSPIKIKPFISSAGSWLPKHQVIKAAMATGIIWFLRCLRPSPRKNIILSKTSRTSRSCVIYPWDRLPGKGGLPQSPGTKKPPLEGGDSIPLIPITGMTRSPYSRMLHKATIYSTDPSDEHCPKAVQKRPHWTIFHRPVHLYKCF